MKKSMRKTISVLLTALMMFTAMPFYAMAESSYEVNQMEKSGISLQAVKPGKMTEVIGKFTDSLSKFVADTSKLSSLSASLLRFSGGVSLAGGVIGALQMAGIIKDPMYQKLSNIMDEIHSMQDQLDQMDQKLDDINQQLIGIAVNQEEKDRNNNATTMLKYWDEFNRDYSEPLDDLMNEYQGKINAGIRAWWEKGGQESMSVLYTGIEEKTSETSSRTTYQVTYSSAESSSSLPDTADNGEKVIKEQSYIIPAEYIPDTSTIKFNINTYRDEFIKAMSENFIKAVDAHKLDGYKTGYSLWSHYGDTVKQRIAERNADAILNTVIYHVSCDVMSENDDWVIKVTNAYKKYCNNVLKQNSGINAMLNAMFLTHGFEGEIKDDIETFCDSMIAQAGIYGEFALGCACQDEMQSIANREAVQTLFADTVDSLSEKKSYAITGHDNFCYITGTRVEHSTVEANSSIKVHNKGSAYKGYSSTDWSATIPSMLNNVYSQVLYHQYQTQPQGKTSFSSYLKEYGAFKWDNWTGSVMTNYVGQKTFSLNEGIRMKANSHFAGQNYFKSGSYYKINTGNDSKIEDQYFHVHDKVLYDSMNMGTGAVSVNQLAGARAFYGESHSYWRTDEPWVFYTDNTYTGTATSISGSDRYSTATFAVTLNVLKLLPVKDLNGDNGTPEDPFYAFDAPALPAETAASLGPVVEGNKAPITRVKLKKSKFTYTGKSVKIPAKSITVKAGKKTVPSKYYKVSYLDNKEVGFATIKITGKGKYSGQVSLAFKIMPKGTSIKKVIRSAAGARVTWKKQRAKMTSRKMTGKKKSVKMSSQRVTGYQIRYSQKSSMKKAKLVTVKGWKRAVKTVKGLKAGRKYYFQIRTFVKVKGGKICSKWSKRIYK